MGCFTGCSSSNPKDKSRFRSKTKKEGRIKLVPTYLNQNYVDRNDLRALLEVRFVEFKISTLDDGSTMVEAARKLTSDEIEYLQKLKAEREPREDVFPY